MPAPPQLGLSVESYHLARGPLRHVGPIGRQGMLWILDHALELKLRALQLPCEEVIEDELAPYLARPGLTLTLTMGLPQMDLLAERLALAVRLPARTLRIILARDPMAWRHFQADQAGLLRTLDRVAEEAEKAGVRVLIENHGDYAAWQLAVLLREIDSPWLGVCFNTSTPLITLEDTVAALRSVAPFVTQVQLRDCRMVRTPYGLRCEGVPLGSGRVDLPEIVRILRNECPAERCMIECTLRANREWSAEQILAQEALSVVRSVAYAHEYLGL